MEYVLNLGIRKLGGHQINHQNLLNFRCDLLSYKLSSHREKNLNIFALKYEYFAIFLYRTLPLEEMKTVQNWTRPSRPLNTYKRFLFVNLSINNSYTAVFSQNESF